MKINPKELGSPDICLRQTYIEESVRPALMARSKRMIPKARDLIRCPGVTSARILVFEEGNVEEIRASKESKILIIDDDESVRMFLDMFLRKKGYSQVLLAATGQQGLKVLAEEENIGVILLDVMLPDINGLELLRQIKKIIKRDIGVIMITGYPDEEKAKQAITEGAYDYIIKPFDLAYLELSLLTKIVKMA